MRKSVESNVSVRNEVAGVTMRKIKFQDEQMEQPAEDEPMRRVLRSQMGSAKKEKPLYNVRMSYESNGYEKVPKTEDQSPDGSKSKRRKKNKQKVTFDEQQEQLQKEEEQQKNNTM